MVTINNVTNFPVIRPLAVTDKLDIIKLSQEIETYDISIRPYEDCCTIFKPKKPKTKPKMSECEYFESKWDWASQIDECVASLEGIIIAEEE
jgi:thiamine biosynthesis protein ThiI